MLYEIINPSDPYTISADEFRYAAIAVIYLGRGRFGLRSEDGSKEMPLFMFADFEEFVKTEAIDFKSISPQDWLAVADVLGSIVIGSFAERREVESELAKMNPDDRAEWFVARHYHRRSSMNDIGSSAIEMAAKMRERWSQPQTSD